MEKHVAAFKGHQMAIREIEAVSKTIPQVQWFTQTVFSRDSTSAGKKRAVITFCISHRDNKDARELLRITWELLSQEMNSDGPGLGQQKIKVISNS